MSTDDFNHDVIAVAWFSRVFFQSVISLAQLQNFFILCSKLLFQKRVTYVLSSCLIKT